MNLGSALPRLGSLLSRWFGTRAAEAPTHRTQSRTVAGAPPVPRRTQLAPSSRTTIVTALIEVVLGVVDYLLAGVPNPVPSAGQLRLARQRGLPVLVGPARRVRRPLLAGIGTADLLAEHLLRQPDVQEPEVPAEREASSATRSGRGVIGAHQLGRGGTSPAVSAQPVPQRRGEVAGGERGGQVLGEDRAVPAQRADEYSDRQIVGLAARAVTPFPHAAGGGGVEPALGEVAAVAPQLLRLRRLVSTTRARRPVGARRRGRLNHRRR